MEPILLLVSWFSQWADHFSLQTTKVFSVQPGVLLPVYAYLVLLATPHPNIQP